MEALLRVLGVCPTAMAHVGSPFCPVACSPSTLSNHSRRHQTADTSTADLNAPRRRPPPFPSETKTTGVRPLENNPSARDWHSNELEKATTRWWWTRNGSSTVATDGRRRPRRVFGRSRLVWVGCSWKVPVGREADAVVLLQEDEGAGEGEDVAPSIGDTENPAGDERVWEFFCRALHGEHFFVSNGDVRTWVGRVKASITA
jgi:hypothetical protein